MLKNIEDIFNMDLNEVRNTSGFFLCQNIIKEMPCSLFNVPLIGPPGTPSQNRYTNFDRFFGNDDQYIVFKPTNTGISDYPTTKSE